MLDLIVSFVMPAANDRATVFDTKLTRAAPRAEVVRRGRLLARISTTAAPVVVICAPAGYGKTTLLSQYAEALDQSVAWISLDTSDNDPVRLMTEIASAFDRVVPVDPLVFSGLQAPEPSLHAEVLPRLVNSLARGPAVALMLDNVERVHSTHCLELLAVLCEQLPKGAKLLIAARETPALPLARMRAHGLLLELGPADLALDPSEAWHALDAMDISIESDAFDGLFERTEGWPAGLYLAAVAVRDAPNPSRSIREFGGDDRGVFEYLSGELLAGQPADRLAFLRRTSVLDRLSGPLCDAMLEQDDSALVLEDLERTGFVLPLDRRREWYRYHRLFAEVLRTALARTEPRLAPDLHARAARWHELNGSAEEAIEHTLASQDRGRAARLLSEHLRDLFNHGRQVTIQRWLRAFTDDDMLACPQLASGAAWSAGLAGDRLQTLHYLRIVEQADCAGPFPLGESSSASAAALLRAAFGWDGVSQMRGMAEHAYRLESAGSGAHERGALFLGANLLLRGRTAAAQALLEEASTLGEAGASSTIFALGLLALIEVEARQFDQAQVRIDEGLALIDRLNLAGYTGSGSVLAARACLAVDRGDRATAESALGGVLALLPQSKVLPWWSILLTTLGGRVALALGDVEQATGLLVQARRDLARYPDAGMLPHRLAHEERALEAAHGGAAVLREPLTEAEMRVLELAPTHLTLEEIGGNLCISRNTVKTHLKAIYSKLNVASRGAAVERAHAVGLIGRHSGSS